MHQAKYQNEAQQSGQEKWTVGPAMSGVTGSNPASLFPIGSKFVGAMRTPWTSET
jgi:hypothetical protein